MINPLKRVYVVVHLRDGHTIKKGIRVFHSTSVDVKETKITSQLRVLVNIIVRSLVLAKVSFLGNLFIRFCYIELICFLVFFLESEFIHRKRILRLMRKPLKCWFLCVKIYICLIYNKISINTEIGFFLM